MTTWRSDPDLAGKLHPQHPDDIQVLVHDGEPRRTQRAPEGCWVRITGTDGVLSSPLAPPGATAPPTSQSVRRLERTIYVGQLLNQPHQLTTLAQGSAVRFVHAPGMPAPLLVTRAYETERPRWAFTPCDRCGADQALDPPSIMARTRFPNAPPGSVPVAFSAFCPCGGTMMLAHIEDAIAAPPGSVGAGAAAMHSSQGPARGGSSGTRMLLFGGLGCLGLVAMCCLSGVGGLFWQRSGHESVARAHVESFLGMVQARQWSGALAAAEYGGDGSLYDAGQFGACLMATPLAEMASYTCPSASSEWPIDDGAHVVCTVTTPRGPTEITVTVNNTDALPYLGYVWFSSDAALGPAWHGDECARWSGRDYVDDAPADRVRP
jgi:hypothetical protein